MSKAKTAPEWWIIKGERRAGSEWLTVYIANKRSLSTNIRGATRYPSFMEASRDLNRIQCDWSDTSDEIKWRLRVVGLRVKAAK